MELIQNIHFEGNIRELRNLAERLNYSDQQYIDAGELKRYLDQDVYGDEGANRQETELLEQFLSENSGRLDRILPVPVSYTHLIRISRSLLSRVLRSALRTISSSLSS